MDYSIGLMYISIYYAPLFKREGDRAKYSSNLSITHSFLNQMYGRHISNKNWFKINTEENRIICFI